jgi:hypothetical protein
MFMANIYVHKKSVLTVRRFRGNGMRRRLVMVAAEGWHPAALRRE